jgi:hypothetical protein
MAKVLFVEEFLFFRNMLVKKLKQKGEEIFLSGGQI